MKIIYIGLGAIITIAIGFLVINNNSTSNGTTQIESAVLSSSAKIYDVRTAEEFTSSHAEGAILFPLDKIKGGEFPDVSKDSPIAVYCRSGNRSAQAKQLLADAGFTNVQDLGGLTNLQNFKIKVIN